MVTVATKDDENRGREDNSLKQDRISELPDSILLHILSFLPAEDSVKTGTFSQRWLYLWTSVPKLCFIKKYANIFDFVKFVDQTLFFHTCCTIREFEVRFFYDESLSLAPSIDRWVRFAVRANVEDLCLIQYFPAISNYSLPQHAFKNSSIKKLSLKWCELVPKGQIRWKSLQSLSLKRTRMSEDVIQNILAGSPVLEILELKGFYGFNRLDIGLAKLRKLVLNKCCDNESGWLEIYAPNLESLIINGNMREKMISLINVQSLVDCELDFYMSTKADEKVMVKQLFDSLGPVKKLFIRHSVLHVLSILELERGLPLLFKLSKCQSLILDCYAKEDDLCGIACLLKNSPCLETLVVNIIRDLKNRRNFSVEGWKLQKESYEYSLLHLKTVDIVFGSLGKHGGFELVKFVLEKSRVLEKMVVKRKDVSSRRLLNLFKKLIGPLPEHVALVECHVPPKHTLVS